MEAQQCVLCIAERHMSLPTTWNTLRYSSNVPDIFVRI